MDKFDPLLLNIASGGSIEDLLDTFFGFLARKTDFYSQPQKARDLCKAYVDKHITLYEEQASQNRAKPDPLPKTVACDRIQELRCDGTRQEATPVVPCLQTPKSASQISKKDGPLPSSETSTEEIEGRGGASSGKKKLNHGNGYDTDQYSWAQTLNSLEISVPLSQTNIKTRNCKVEIQKSRLTITVEGQLVMDEEFAEPVKEDESFWTLVDGRSLQISLEKFVGTRWWSRAFAKHAELETSKIVPESSKLSDLDGETRKTVEKMLYDQRQKQLGLPTSEQREQLELLERFKKSHPEMDFSNAKMSF